MNPDPFSAALFLIVGLSLAGLLQAAWLRSPSSHPFRIPVDGGILFRGRRIFDDNKMLRGFMAMVPGSALSFALLAGILKFDAGRFPLAPWDLSILSYALLGGWAGFGFMLGELPNSFVKRQLDVPPGKAPRRRAVAAAILVTDRIDSILGMLVAVSLAVSTPWWTWAYVLLFGSAIHGAFSPLLFLWA